MRTRTHSAVSHIGQPYISIRLVMTSLHNGAATCSYPLPKKTDSSSFACRENAGPKGNTGHTILQPYQVIQNAWNKYNTGITRSHDPLAQINLALLFGEESQLPFYYRKLSGNITDVKTVKNLLADLDYFGYQKVHMVMDRGFYSEDNVNSLFRDHIKFLMGVRLSLRFVKTVLEQHRDSVRTWSNYYQKYDIYTKLHPNWVELYTGTAVQGW